MATQVARELMKRGDSLLSLSEELKKLTTDAKLVNGIGRLQSGYTGLMLEMFGEVERLEREMRKLKG